MVEHSHDLFANKMKGIRTATVSCCRRKLSPSHKKLFILLQLLFSHVFDSVFRVGVAPKFEKGSEVSKISP